MHIGTSDFRACLEAVHVIASAGAGLGDFVLDRRLDFDARERRHLELIRRHLGDLYRLARAVDDARAAWGVPGPGPSQAPEPDLTPRESEVLGWLGGGKTDRDIADILGISPRTVHKHLQRIYEKLGVETRTAAVVRAMQLRGAEPRMSLQGLAGSGELPL